MLIAPVCVCVCVRLNAKQWLHTQHGKGSSIFMVYHRTKAITVISLCWVKLKGPNMQAFMAVLRQDLRVDYLRPNDAFCDSFTCHFHPLCHHTFFAPSWDVKGTTNLESKSSHEQIGCLSMSISVFLHQRKAKDGRQCWKSSDGCYIRNIAGEKQLKSDVLLII